MEPSLSEVNTILREYDLGEARSIRRLHSGYANMNFSVVVTKKGREDHVLLRVCREKSMEEIGYELKVMERLLSLDFPAAYPLPRKDGGMISKHDLGPVVIYQFMEGNEPECNSATVGEIARAVATLNSLKDWEDLRRTNALGIDLCHDVIARFDDSPCQHPELYDWFREETEFLDPALREELPRGLIHGDVFPDNTMFQGNALKAILDWEEVCTDILLIDVGVTINGFCFRGNMLDIELMDHFLSEYQKVRELSEKELELLPYFIRWGSLSMIAWHLKFITRRNDPRKMDRVRMFRDRLDSLPKDFKW